MKRPQKELYFLYKLAPFRPLYLNTPLGSGPAFFMPLSKTDLSALPTHKRPVLWRLGDKRLAARLAKLNKAMYDKHTEFKTISAQRSTPAQKPTSAIPRSVQPTSLTELA